MGQNCNDNFGCTREYELQGISKFIAYYSEVGIGSSSGDSACETDWMDISFMDEVYTFSWSSDQVDESESTRLLRFRLMLGENVRSLRSKSEMGKSSEISTVRFIQRIIWSWWKADWVRVAYFPMTYVIGNPPKNPERSASSKHWVWEIWRSSHLHVDVQWHWMDKERQFRTVYYKFRTRQELREEILARAVDIPWNW